MARVALREFAQARSGDKGDTVNIALFAPTEDLYEVIKKKVTTGRVKQHFKGWIKGKVERYEAPNVLALNFVAHQALGGGASSSLRLDPLGKSYSSNLLRLVIQVDDELVRSARAKKPPETI